MAATIPRLPPLEGRIARGIRLAPAPPRYSPPLEAWPVEAAT